MKRQFLNLVVDLASLLLIVALAATGLVIRFVLPPGSAGRRQGGWMLWGMGRHDWGDLHFWLSLAAAGIMIVHLVLHWAWIRSITLHLTKGTGSQPIGRLRRMVWIVGLPAIIVVALGGFWMAASSQTVTSQLQCEDAEVSSSRAKQHRGNGPRFGQARGWRNGWSRTAQTAR